MTFEQRCRLIERCIPECPFKEQVIALHNEMLEALRNDGAASTNE